MEDNKLTAAQAIAQIPKVTTDSIFRSSLLIPDLNARETYIKTALLRAYKKAQQTKTISMGDPRAGISSNTGRFDRGRKASVLRQIKNPDYVGKGTKVC